MSKVTDTIAAARILTEGGAAPSAKQVADALDEWRGETPEQVEARRAVIRQDVADLLGNLGYELDSDDETYEVLAWAFERTPESPVTPEQGPIERCRECGREEWGHSWLDHVK